MKRLFHVSFVVNETIDVFTPRIPITRALNEDNVTPRVCTAPSLECCLLANPYTAELFEPEGHVEEGSVIMVCHKSQDDTHYGVPFIQYEFYVEDKDVLPPASLQFAVPDVEETSEHWIVRKVEPESKRYFLLKDAYLGKNGWMYDYLELNLSEFERLMYLDPSEFRMVY